MKIKEHDIIKLTKNVIDNHVIYKKNTTGTVVAVHMVKGVLGGYSVEFIDGNKSEVITVFTEELEFVSRC